MLDRRFARALRRPQRQPVVVSQSLRNGGRSLGNSPRGQLRSRWIGCGSRSAARPLRALVTAQPLPFGPRSPMCQCTPRTINVLALAYSGRSEQSQYEGPLYARVTAGSQGADIRARCGERGPPSRRLRVMQMVDAGTLRPPTVRCGAATARCGGHMLLRRVTLHEACTPHS